MGAITATARGKDAQGFLWIGKQTDSIATMVPAPKKCSSGEHHRHYVWTFDCRDGKPWFAGTRGIAFYKMASFRNWRFQRVQCHC